MDAGIHKDLPFQDYLNETDWVSASMLKNFLPEYFRPFNGSPAADVGSVLHSRFTGDDTPVTVVDAATWTGKAAAETRTAVVASGGYAILEKDRESIDGMERSLRAHSEARRLLVDEPGAWELSVFAEVDEVPSKCRFDRLLDDGTAVDVKTTKAGPGSYELTKTVIQYGYDLAENHYRAVAAGAGIDLTGFCLLFVQNVAPYHVTVVELDEAFMERAAALRDLALSRYLHGQMVDPYEGATGRLSLSLPGWARLG